MQTCPGRRTAASRAPEELVELITHLAFYVGWPNAMSAVTRAKELFENKKETP